MVSKETKLLKQMFPIYYDVIKKMISSQEIHDVIFPFQVLIRINNNFINWYNWNKESNYSSLLLKTILWIRNMACTRPIKNPS